MRRASAIALGLAIGFVSLSPTATSQVFKCKDAEGNVTYTDVPCLRSESGSVVDTRASTNVADHSSIRRDAGRLQSAPVAPPSQGSSQGSSAEPPAAPSARSTQRSGGYSR